MLEPLGLEGGVRRGRRAAGEDPRGRGRAARARARDRDGPGGRRPRRRALARAAARARPRPRRVRVARRATQAVDARGHLPLHLHVRHHRPAQGLPALARATTARSPTPWSRTAPLEEGDCVLPVPAARARVRDPDPVRHLRPRRGDRLLVARPEDDHRRHHAGEPDLLPVGAADVREDLHARHLATSPDKEGLAARRSSVGREGAHDARGAARRCPAELQAGLRPGRGALFKNVRGLFGDEHPRVRHRRRADRAGDPRVLLRLRRAGDGGLRHDRDLHQRDGEPPGARRVPLRLGGQGRSRASR